jgi:predicted cobalt transporter CbtA
MEWGETILWGLAGYFAYEFFNYIVEKFFKK